MAGGEDSAVSATGAAEGLGLLSGSRKHCSWGVVGWTLVALIAEPWTIKQEMFSLGENLTHYTSSSSGTPSSGLHRSHTLLPAVIAHCCVAKKVRTRRNHLLAFWLPVTLPLSMYACAHAPARVQGGLSRLGLRLARMCMEAQGLPCLALPMSLGSTSHPLRSLAGQRGPLGCALPPRTLLTRSRPLSPRAAQGWQDLGVSRHVNSPWELNSRGPQSQSWQG